MADTTTLGLTGKVALISGASRGIGAAIAAELAREGVDLFLTARGRPDLEVVGAQIRDASKRRILVKEADLRMPEAAAVLVREATDGFGRLDILVNCAGDTRSKPFFETTDGDWLDAFGVKFHGAVRMSKAAWPHLRSTQGCIVNIAGNTARTGSAELAINGAVNAALLHFTKALSDVGRRDGIRVNTISPGRIATRRLDRTVDRIATEQVISREDAARKLLDSTGIARFGEPQEIAWLVAYLSSPRAGFIQGTIIEIDGGETRAV